MEDKDLFEKVDNIVNDERLNTENPIKEKRKKSHKLIIIFLIIIIALLFFIKEIYEDSKYESDDDYYSDYEKDYEEYEEEFSDEFDSFYDYQDYKDYEEFEELKENINIKSSVGINKSINLEITNENNQDPGMFEIYLIFYDGNDKAIDILSKNIDGIYPNGKYYCSFNSPIAVQKEYERYEILLKRDYKSENKSVDLKDIDFTSYVENDDIVIECTNNSNVDINYIEFSIIYYNENKNIVFIDTGNEYDLKKGKKEKFEYVFSRMYEDIEYDNYEIFINYAESI